MFSSLSVRETEVGGRTSSCSGLGLAGSKQGGRPWPQGPSPGSAGPLCFTSKNKHVPQAWPVPPGQSRLCARPAAPAAQAILISVWVHAGVTNQSPRSSAPAPRPPPLSRALSTLLAAAGSGGVSSSSLASRASDPRAEPHSPTTPVTHSTQHNQPALKCVGR